MSILAQILLLSVLSGVLSMIGGWILLGNERWVRKFSIHFVSFAVGTLLAASFLDLLPEAFKLQQKSANSVLAYTLGGIIVFFLIEQLLHKFHIHHHEDNIQHLHATPLLLSLGDGLHNFVDGLILVSAFLVNPSLGVITAVAVAAHELPQEITDFSIMLHHGWSKSLVFLSNLLVSLTNVLGAVIAYTLRDIITPFLPAILGFTAGIFIYIATSDLFPEISPRASRDKTSHVIFLLFLGIASIWILGRLVEI